MRMKNRIMHVLLALAMCLTVFAGSARADTTLGIQTAVPGMVGVGETAEITVSLTGYDEAAYEADAIRGVQVDITGIDPAVLSVEGCESLIADTTAVSNTASYNQAKKLVRLVYAQFNGTLPAPCEALLKAQFKVNPDLTESGSITLPVTVKIQTVSQQITQKSEIVIRYEPEIIRVEIAWGALNYTYDKGTWNPETHAYDGGGWKDGSTGYITVTNTGNTETTAEFLYETQRDEVAGHFTDGSAKLTAPLPLAVGEEAEVYLNLTGEPAEDLTAAQIGRVTVRIGGE